MSNNAPNTGDKKAISAKAIVAIVILILALIFVFSNLHDSTTYFLWMSFTIPAWIWFLIVLVAGVVVGSLFPWFRPKKKK